MKQLPSIGRIVHYMLTSAQALNINNDRRYSAQTAMEAGMTSADIRGGNPVNAGDVCPMIITHVDQFSSGAFVVNGQVFLDGNDSLWVKHTIEGIGPGCWQWPAIVGGEGQRALRPNEGPQGEYYGGAQGYNPPKAEPDQWTEEEQRRAKLAAHNRETAKQKDHILSNEELERRPDKHLEEDKRTERSDD